MSWRADPTRIVISVANTGPGIAAEDLPYLFEPLYWGETSRSADMGGAGLGLIIARRIQEAHGGDLTAANRRSGGAVFTGTVAAAAAPDGRVSGLHFWLPRCGACLWHRGFHFPDTYSRLR